MTVKEKPTNQVDIEKQKTADQAASDYKITIHISCTSERDYVVVDSLTNNSTVKQLKAAYKKQTGTPTKD